MKRHWLAAILLVLLGLPAPPARTADYPPAPTAMQLGIMQGRPVPEGKRVTLANWMSAPFNRWSLQHIPQLLPTATVYRGNEPAVALPVRRRDLDSLQFEAAPGRMLSIAEWLATSYTDGFIVVQDGRIVYEAYLLSLIHI